MIEERLRELVVATRDVVDRVEEVAVSGAAELVESFAELERLAVAGRTLAGRRVERAGLWRELGYRSPAQWMAVRAQSTMGAAIATLETGRKLDELPATREAFTAGLLSAHQAQEITAAASLVPSAEGRLLGTARDATVAQLREECRQVIASVERDADADERLHRSRYLRHWMDADGALRLDARLTPEAGARLVAAVAARAGVMRHRARGAGSPERAEASAGHGLVSLADASTPGPRAIVHVHVDNAAWQRGRTIAGETCRAGGIGPISVSAARRLASDGIVKAVVDDGADVRAVAHFGRTIPARSERRWRRATNDVSCRDANSARISRSTISCRSRRAEPRRSPTSPGCAVPTTR